MQEKIQHEKLKPLVYKRGKERALKSKEFFETVMKLDAVEICRNLTKDEILEKFEEIKK